MPEFKQGDHLAVQGRLPWIGKAYTHHGLFMGNDVVMHFATPTQDPRDAEIRPDPLSVFAGGQVPWVVHDDEECDAIERVMERAWSKRGERGYDAEQNNCEQFVTYCRTGKHHSS